MLKVRKANERGHVKHSWLDSYHTFSFGSYFDPENMGFKNLRVINDDIIDEGMGFATHPHRDMEIITFMIDGTVEHKDSMGNIKQVQAGEIQVMSAGSGIQHSEYNPSKDEKTRLYQIWIEPKHKGVEPSYSQVSYQERKKPNELTLLVSGNGEENSLPINQDAKIYLGHLDESNSIELNPSRPMWIQMITGTLAVNGEVLGDADGLAIENEEKLEMVGNSKSEFLVFEL
jgi:redox-sensitive bicupin YhaK (pirin superfamily)